MKNKLVRRVAASVLLFGSSVWGTGSLYAEKPAVTGLYPAGGQVGQTLDVEPVGKLGSNPVKVWTDRKEVSAEVTKDGKKLQVSIAKEAKPGVYWLRVWNAEGASSLRPFIVGRLPEVQEKEPNETLSAAQAVDATGTVINGKLHKSGELDTYKVTLKKGQTLVADLVGNTILKSPMDAVLQVFSAEGFQLAHADDSPKLDPQLAYTAPKDGEYFVRVFAFPETPNSSIRYAGGADYIYRLTLTTGPYAHH
ncbi:MAG: PPC domain-containing protein, partial [Planctomycetaceae bacterium]|nr:PPC domain-containing protein [Planctomycetaceae bacterium]